MGNSEHNVCAGTHELDNWYLNLKTAKSSMKTIRSLNFKTKTTLDAGILTIIKHCVWIVIQLILTIIHNTTIKYKDDHVIILIFTRTLTYSHN